MALPSLIYAPKLDEEHLRPFHMGVPSTPPPKPGLVVNSCVCESKRVIYEEVKFHSVIYEEVNFHTTIQVMTVLVLPKQLNDGKCNLVKHIRRYRFNLPLKQLLSVSVQ